MDGPRPQPNGATARHAGAMDDLPRQGDGLHADREFQQNLRWVHEQLEQAASHRARQASELTAVG
jgi:hypothetical protein